MNANNNKTSKTAKMAVTEVVPIHEYFVSEGIGGATGASGHGIEHGTVSRVASETAHGAPPA